MNPTLPASVKVGFKIYEIHPWPTSQMLDDQSLGRCEHQANTIRIGTEGRSAFDVVETLIHEILHACWYVSKLHDDDEEERIVGCTASSLAAVLADNPDLRRYLAEVYG